MQPRLSRNLLLVTLVSATGGFLFGYDTIVINGANQYLKAFFNLTPFQEGFAGASAILGCIPGAMCAGFISDRYGRRNLLFLCAVLYGISAIWSAVPQTFTEFLIARFIGGLGVGASSMVCPVYVAELAPAKWRGRLGALFQVGIVSGALVTVFINAQIHGLGDESWNTAYGWRWMLGAELVPSLFFLGLLFFTSESPRWLLGRGREAEARVIFESVSDREQAGREIAAVKAVLGRDEGRFSELLGPRYRPALIIAVALMAGSQFSGINAIAYYSTKIFATAGAGMSDAFRATVMITLIGFVCALLAFALVDRVGRRPLLIFGNTVQVLALGTVAWFFFQGSAGLPLLVAVLVFGGVFNLAMGPLPWIISAEILPAKLRGRAMSVATFVIWSSCYVVAQTFPMLHDNPSVGPARTFLVYAACSLATLIFVLIKVPETKGRTLEEIESAWQARKR